MNILKYRDVEYDLDENRNYEIEEWRPVNIGDVKSRYYVSNMGRVKNIDSGKILRPWMSNVGYLVISLPTRGKGKSPKDLTIHRLVLSAFTDDYEKIHDNRYIINHKDGIKHHSYLSNLEWVTYSENYFHAVDMDLCNNTGENTYNAIHTEAEVRMICELLCQDSKISYEEICEKLGIEFTPHNQKFISEIATRKKWRQISKEYPFNTRTIADRHAHSDEEVRHICELFSNGYKIKDVIIEFKIPSEKRRRYLTFLYTIRNRTAYKSISKDYIW